MKLSRRTLLTHATGLLGPALCPFASAAGLVDLVASLKPSVCAIGSVNPLDSPRFRFRGSGFVVGNGSLVATCWHVLPESGIGEEAPKPGLTSLAVLLPSGDGAPDLREAELIGSDRAHDLALLRIQGRPGVPVALAADGAAREGMEVALMGYPIGGVLGFKPVTHRGIVSAIVASSLPTRSSRELTESNVSRLRQGSFELLQLDATAYPGNSGGPLLDTQTQQVIGVVNMVLLKGNRESALSQPTGITYAVPVRHLRELMARS
jgi:S1-C subfamily serine protease